MHFLINCSNLKAGGGLQVADSICCQLYKFHKHHFYVVLSDYMEDTSQRINGCKNVTVFSYTIPNDLSTIILGRSKFLDDIVSSQNINAILTVFGPSRWKPRVPHFSGFALPQLVIPESPYFGRMGIIELLKWKLWCKIRQWSLKRSASFFWTENPFISDRLAKLIRPNNVFTVSNYYNQIFDDEKKWNRNTILPSFDGTTCLSVSTYSSHKNLEIIEEIVRYLSLKHPSFRVRFVLTIDSDEMKMSEGVKENVIFVGKKDISEIPYLYEQCDIMFMPTLLECFTATYPEAMRMHKPIVTTDLEFARGLCGDAACYYSAVDSEAAAEAIYKVATDKYYSKKLVKNGEKQLLTYDNYEQRAEKLITILEEISR